MVIGLTGKLQSGKDTIADHLVAKYEFRKVGFSDQLYEGVAALFGITVEEALEYKKDVNVEIVTNVGDESDTVLGRYTWREILQRFGTEMGRDTFGRDFWVERFSQRYLMIPQNLVVRDVRFDNEAHCITATEIGGHIWHVHRPGYEGDNHPSEAGIHEAYINAEIENNGTLEELYELIDKAMVEVYGFDAK